MHGWTVMIAWRSGHVASIQSPTLYFSKSFNTNRTDVIIIVNCQSQLCDGWIVWHCGSDNVVCYEYKYGGYASYDEFQINANRVWQIVSQGYVHIVQNYETI